MPDPLGPGGCDHEVLLTRLGLPRRGPGLVCLSYRSGSGFSEPAEMIFSGLRERTVCELMPQHTKVPSRRLDGVCESGAGNTMANAVAAEAP